MKFLTNLLKVGGLIVGLGVFWAVAIVVINAPLIGFPLLVVVLAAAKTLIEWSGERGGWL